MMALRRGASTFAARLSPIWIVPAVSLPMCENAAPRFWVSDTVNFALTLPSSPASPTWPPDSA
jgi:hypothetical protein